MPPAHRGDLAAELGRERQRPGAVEDAAAPDQDVERPPGGYFEAPLVNPARGGRAAMEPWPEDPVPAGVCLPVLADHGTRAVWGEGSRTGSVCGILDNPGAREDAAGRPFVCGTRQTLRLAMDAAGLSEADFYLTFLLKRRPRRAYDHPAAWAASLPVLRRQVQAFRPRVLVCMGDTVAKALWGPEACVRALRGRPAAWEGWPAVVTYHPLAARRRPQLLPLLIADLREAVDHV